MSLATKIAAGLCICPVVAAPTALLHKPTRDKIARAAGYVPQARKPVSSPIAVNPQIACAEPSPSGPAIAMNDLGRQGPLARSEEHTSELQSLMRISYAVFCLKKHTKQNII